MVSGEDCGVIGVDRVRVTVRVTGAGKLAQGARTQGVAIRLG